MIWLAVWATVFAASLFGTLAFGDSQLGRICTAVLGVIIAGTMIGLLVFIWLIAFGVIGA
ncbi:hypothetical protein [Paramicrobacterium agarici]|uniref:hypothetical protein n=1 Tax=Paramicrobacterium agarici TaxID=630514 RepID=UPI00115299EA|nr:hypothetical protein [Microbacterium agarici]TQO23826.1 hypothetical protein FB385_2688 [Microbacterium agarici]